MKATALAHLSSGSNGTLRKAESISSFQRWGGQPEDLRNCKNKRKQAKTRNHNAILVKVTHPQRQVIQVVMRDHIWYISRAIDARQLSPFPGSATFRRPGEVINWPDLRAPIRPGGNMQTDTGTRAGALSAPHRRP